ncbi:MAG: hypothetical protein ACTHNS_03735 [Marmoricola sp.]
MTDPLTAFLMLAAAIAATILVIGGGVWICVRVADADHPPVQRGADALEAPKAPNAPQAPQAPAVSETPAALAS